MFYAKVVAEEKAKQTFKQYTKLFLNGRMTTKQLKKPQGDVISNGVELKRHEKDIVKIFTDLGYNVELIPTARQRQAKTADAIINGLEWEFKTPRESSTDSLERLLRRATSQSLNIVIDLRRLKIPNHIAIKRVTYAAQSVKIIKRLRVIADSAKIIDIK